MKKIPKVLVACEESGILTRELRRVGIHAFSCDIMPTSGGLPEFHLMMDAKQALKLWDWDGVFAFPPCTDLCSSGARWFKEKQADGRQQASIDFFMLFADCESRFVLIENPIGIMSNKYKKPSQIIQPWQFGHGETKATCLWLKNLPQLQPTRIVEGREARVWKMGPSPERAKLRSKTYEGIARAMANQHGRYIMGVLNGNRKI